VVKLTLDARQPHSEKHIEAVLASGECALSAKELANIETDAGRTALHVAAEKGHLDKITGGATVDDLTLEASFVEEFALHVAARHGHLDQVQGGANLSQLAGCLEATSGRSALDDAVEGGHAGQICCNETADQLLTDKRGCGFPPLLYVAEHGLFTLVKGGVTVDQLKKAKRQDGESALHYAAWDRHLGKIPGGVTCLDLGSVANTRGFSALHVAARTQCLDQIHGGVTGAALAAVKDKEGVTALHTAVSYDALHQVSGLNMNLLIKTIDNLGRSAMGYALEHMDSAEYDSIPGFRSQELPEGVMFSKSKTQPDHCLLQYLLTSKKLPKGFVCSQWFEWAAIQEPAALIIDSILPRELDQFMENVDAELLASHLSLAKSVAQLAGGKTAAAIWLTRALTASKKNLRAKRPAAARI
jgi:hypothetical protein